MILNYVSRLTMVLKIIRCIDTKLQNWKNYIMGCEISKQDNNDIVSIETTQEFKLSFRELVTQDRGHIFQLYHFSGTVSRSNYCIVRKVVSRATKQSKICKIIPLLNQKYFLAISEIEYLKKLDHPNIVQILQYFLEPTFLYIILELVPGERILVELNKVKQGIVFQCIVQIMQQLLRAVEYCHSRSIAHRAINTQNILLFFRQGKPFVKLIDFSQACTIGSPKASAVPLQKRNVILNQNQQAQPDKIDIFDCGIVFYALLKGRRIQRTSEVANYNELIENLIKCIKQLNLSKKIEKDLTDFMKLVLSEDPKSRPSAIQCLNHPFFQNFDQIISSKKALECLMTFQGQNNLKYLFSMYASLNMISVLDKSQYVAQFYNLDKNQDGEIQFQELVEGVQNTFNMESEKAKQHAEQIFANLDKNKSGSLNFSEYITGTIELSKLVSGSFLQKMFKQIDTNQDGQISEQEVNNLISGIDRYNILEGQKEVNFKQFKQMMMKALEKSKGFIFF